jgi:hypothetical protein
VRDTILGALIIGALLWSVVSLKTLKRIMPGALPPVATDSKSSVRPESDSKLAQHPLRHRPNGLYSFKGEISERHRKSGKTKIHPESTGSPGDAAEIEKLSSIYAPESGPVPVSTAGITNSDAKNSNDSVSPRTAIPGLPVKAYVQYKKNSIYMPTVTAPTDGGLRVFVNCMEVKPKGLTYTGEHKCETLQPKSLADRRPIQPVGPQPF